MTITVEPRCNIDTGRLVVSRVASMIPADITALCRFRDAGGPGFSPSDMTDVTIGVDPTVCLMTGDRFSCAASVYWTWAGTVYHSESFARIEGGVLGGRVSIEAIEVDTSDN